MQHFSEKQQHRQLQLIWPIKVDKGRLDGVDLWRGLYVHRIWIHRTFSFRRQVLVYGTPIDTVEYIVARIFVASDKINTTYGVLERMWHSFIRPCELCFLRTVSFADLHEIVQLMISLCLFFYYCWNFNIDNLLNLRSTHLLLFGLSKLRP